MLTQDKGQPDQKDFRFLAEASARLASSLGYNETLKSVTELLVDRLGGLASVMLVEGDSISIASWHHADPVKRELIAKMDVSVQADGFREMVFEAINTNKSIVLENIEQDGARLKLTPERKADYVKAGVSAFMMVPMVAHGEPIGVISCVCTEPGSHIYPADVALVEEIARRAALAVDHARLFEKTKQSEQAQRFLNEASATLASSLDYEITLKNVASVLVPTMAEWIAIHLLENGEPKRVAVAHANPEKVRWAEEMNTRYPTEMESETGLGAVLTRGKTEFYPVITDEMLAASARDEEHLNVIRQLRVGSAIIVPMVARDEVIGSITFVAPEQGRYQDSDLEFAQELARRAAMAVDNARLFRSVEQRVEERTQELQSVNKELEAFAYSVSHDLRAPLRSIMSASMIVMEDYGEAIGDDGKAELKRASAAAKRMSTLIDDLLEFSRLGRREMNVSEVDLSALTTSIGTEIGLPDGVLQVKPGMRTQGDPALLRVAMTNYLENAWKFSKNAADPRIEVGEDTVDGQRAFFVRDNGVGFDEQYAEKLFVPFERLHSPQDYPGTGIGLANVKRIINRHNGRVWARGRVGEGATFYFTLGR